jgi:hypothetical protein
MRREACTQQASYPSHLSADDTAEAADGIALLKPLEGIVSMLGDGDLP